MKDKRKEYFDKALKESLMEVYNMCCEVLDDIVYDKCKDFGNLDEEIQELVIDEIYSRLRLNDKEENNA